MQRDILIRVNPILYVTGLPPEIKDQLRAALSLPNPAYLAAERRGRRPIWIPPELTLYREEDEAVILPRGFLDRLRGELEGDSYHIVDERLFFPPLPLEFHGELRPYQERACLAMARYGSGILVAPPGSGKTVMAMWLLARWRQPALLICHTLDLGRQLVENARRWLGVEPGFIGDGTWEVGQEVTVALVQSLVSRPEATEDLARRVGLVLVDEAHHTPARTFMDVLQRFPAAFRYGLTATPERRDGLGSFMEAVIGPVRAAISHAESGLFLRPRLEWVRTEFRFPYRDERDYQHMLTALVEDPDRNRLLLRIISPEVAAGRRCLVLTERVAHAEHLAARLARAFPHRVASVTGRDDKAYRQEVLARLREGSLLCVCATRLADEGLDLPELERLFLVTPARAAARVMQRLGRLMRPLPGKADPVVVDFVDPVPVLKSQARTRWFAVYRRLVEGVLPEWLRTTA